MGKTGKLKPRQLAVIEDLFAGEIDEQAVLDKHKVSRRLYNKWLADSDVGGFTDEFDRRIESAFRQSAALIARYAPFAAAKLVQLIGSDKEETVRRACLDIISMHASRESQGTRDDGRQTKDETKPAADSLPISLSPESASKLLAMLAEEKSRH